MFDQIFCIALQIGITASLKQSTDLEQRRCWCNSVVFPDSSAIYLIEHALKTRQLIVKAWIDEGRGEDESLQHLYDLRLNFGDKSIAVLKTGDRLEACVPLSWDSWMTFDKGNRKIELRLI